VEDEDEIRAGLIAAGFPKAAELLDGTEAGRDRARRNVARFEPASFGEAESRARALRVFGDGR